MFIVNITVHPVLCSSIVKLLFVIFSKFTPYHISWSHWCLFHFEIHWGFATIPSRMMHWDLCLYCVFLLLFMGCGFQLALWGWSCLALLSSIGIHLGLLYTGWGVAIGPNVLWSTPFPTQESTFRVMSREFPWMLGWVMLSEHIMQPAKCVLHCTFPESDVQPG